MGAAGAATEGREEMDVVIECEEAERAKPTGDAEVARGGACECAVMMKSSTSSASSCLTRDQPATAAAAAVDTAAAVAAVAAAAVTVAAAAVFALAWTLAE